MESVAARTGQTVELPDLSLEAVNDHFCRAGWSDGLPIVPPTPERVGKMIAAGGRSADEVLGDMPPRWRPTTVHHVAVNTVMAGCRPEYFPVVLAAIKAILDPTFNLHGVQTTTNPCGVVVIVNGPAARALDINAGFNLFGPGWRANATIGRAVRLCLVNIGGAIPGIGDMSTLGSSTKFTACFAENESASPWSPWHVEIGFEPGQSTVTMAASEAAHNVIVLSADPHDILNGISGAMIPPGSNCMRFPHEPVVVLGPQHARHIADAGFQKADVKKYIWEHSKKRLSDLARPDSADYRAVRKWKRSSIFQERGEDVLYVTPVPEKIAIMVAGGVGPHSAILGTYNATHLVTRPIGTVQVS